MASFDRSAPVSVGDQYDVTIEDMGREGDGIAKVDNFVIFVPNVQVGDEIRIRIDKVSRSVAFGEKVDGE